MQKLKTRVFLLKKKFEFELKKVALEGINNITSEFKKDNKDVNVEYEIKNNKVRFIVESKQVVKEKELEQDKSLVKEVKGLKDSTEAPVELLNQQMLQQEFDTSPLVKAMKITQDKFGKKTQKKISKKLM